MQPSLDAAAVSVLEEGRQAYVAVASNRGPHVTPELYTWSDEALWFAAASTTVKAKVLRRDHMVAVVVPAGGRSVLIGGEVTTFDPRRPTGVLSRPRDMPAVARAMARYTARNASDLGAFVGDTARGRLGFHLPPVRVLYRVVPASVAVVENDALTGSWGAWPGADGDGEMTELPVGGESAVIAVPGPFALPGRWFPDEGRAYVPPQALALADLSGQFADHPFPASIVTDAYRAPGPAAKQGTLLRGDARLVAGTPGCLRFDPDRITEWDGIDMDTEEAPKPPSERG